LLQESWWAVGCAAIVIYPDDSKPEEQIVDIGVAESNISRMELMECNRSIEWLRDQGSNLGVTRVQIVTDSRYVHDKSIVQLGGEGTAGATSITGPIENRDLWNLFISLRSSLQVLVTFHWTKGKKSPRLKLVDKAAKNAAKSREHGVEIWLSMAKGKITGAANLYTARGQTEVISPYRSVAIRGHWQG
jgi:ribonuclease HI